MSSWHLFLHYIWKQNKPKQKMKHGKNNHEATFAADSRFFATQFWVSSKTSTVQMWNL